METQGMRLAPTIRRPLLTIGLCLLAMLAPARGEAQPLHLDLSSATIDRLPPESLRINHLKAVGLPGSYRVDFQWDSTTFTFVPVAASVVIETPPTTPPTDPILAKTELLKGHWHFVYTIISTFTDDYSLTTIPGTKNSQGGYFINGTDQFGGPVAAAYFPTDGNWALLDPGTIIDKFYTFLTNGQTLSNGCYYQISPPGSSNFSRCFTLTGVKTSAAAAARAQQEGTMRLESDEARLQEHPVAASGTIPAPPAEILEQYRLLRGE
jgi:hypothetical protein